MKVECKFNDPDSVPIGTPSKFDHGLILGKKYFVMGIMTHQRNDTLVKLKQVINFDDLFYLIDEDGRPFWFPYQIFEITDSSLPFEWYLRINDGSINALYKNLFGFKELCMEDEFFNNLLLREKRELEIYRERKKEFIANYG